MKGLKLHNFAFFNVAASIIPSPEVRGYRAGCIVGSQSAIGVPDEARIVNRSREFRQFLDAIEAQVPAGLEIHLIADNYSPHKTAMIQKWFAKCCGSELR